MRVLIVEDDAASAECLAELVQLWGHEVRMASSAGQALEVAPEFQPEAAVVDLQLPDGDGNALAEELRRRVPSRSLRLIALTGFSSSSDRERATKAGFDRFLVKPADLPTLETLLTEFGAPKNG